MLADIGTAAVIVLVVLLATLLPMYAKWRAMQALVDRLARRGQANAARRPDRSDERGAPERPADSSRDPH
jgi:hypothetical protein